MMTTSIFNRWLARYAIAVGAVALGVLLRMALTAWVGPGLPTYITFYPSVMAAALLAGLGPGLTATALAALVTDYWLLPPAGFGIASSMDVVGLGLFSIMGAAISVVAGLYRRIRRRLENLVAERTRELNETTAALEQQVALIDPARAEIIAMEMQRVLRARQAAGAQASAPAGGSLRRVPAPAGAAVAVAGLLVLAGWLFDVATLKSVLPGCTTTMKVNTAVCFLLAGVALIFRERRALRLACAAIVGAVAAVSLAEYATGIDFGIDQLLVRDPGDPQTIPGRMAQVTALCFIFAGLSLSMTGIKARAALWAQQASALAVGTFGLTALIGYLYGTGHLYGPIGFSSMAANTAVAFAALAGGLLFARPDGLSRALTAAGSGAQFARRLLPAVLIVPVVMGWLHIMGERSDLFSSDTGAGLLVLAMMLSLAAFVWWIASTLAGADAKRLETETQLRSQAELMDQTVEPLIVREMDGAIRFWNRGAEALYGWTAAEAVGQRIHVLLRTEGQPLEEIESPLERTGHWEGELTHTTRDGRRVIVESRNASIHADRGRLLILESNRDITERKKAEERVRQLNVELERRVAEANGANEALLAARKAALNVMEDAVEARRRAEEASVEVRENETRLNRAQEMAHLGSWELDLIHNRLTWSDEVYRIFGLQPQEFGATYEAFLERIHPDDRAAVDAAYSGSLRENRDAYEIEHRIVRKGTGEVRVVHERCQHLRNAEGKIVRSTGMVHDITDLRHLQEKEKEDAARLARAQSAADTIRTMHEGVLLATPDGTVLSANPAMERLTGLAAGDLIGRNLEALFPQLLAGADLLMATEALGSVRAGRTPPLTPVSLRPPGRPPVRMLPSVSFMDTKEKDGGSTVVLTVKDVTQLYEAEEKLRVTGTLLRLFVSAASRKEYLDAAVDLLRDWSGCRCAGIRVTDDQGFIPYESCAGFSREFLDMENRLSLASDGCVCCRVATGTPEPPDRAAMTPGGSFCCGDTLGFVSQLNESERARYRGNCAKQGFASIAVVPIRHQDRFLGAIHLADERRDRVTRESVELLETMALMIGEAIHRFSVERSLRESESRHRLLVEQMPAVTYTIALEDRPRVTYISPQIQSLIGLSVADLQGDLELWTKRIHADDRSRVLAEFEAAIRETRPFDCEYRLIARDGREVWVHDSAVPVHDEGDRSPFLQGVMYDITERRKAEEDRARYEARLRSLAAALSVTEEENRWRISRQIHDTVVQSLSLSNIKLGAIRREAGTAVPADRQKKIDGVRALLDDAVHQARSLMSDLTPPLLYEMGLEPALNELAERLREEHGVAIEVEAEESLPAASHAVRGFLFASARELIVNAVKHARPRRIGVVLRAGVGELVLQVCDDGQGFISEPVRGTRGGTSGGFGLFSIRERVEGLGGQFRIESAPGKGATVTLTVPLKPGPDGGVATGEESSVISEQ